MSKVIGLRCRECGESYPKEPIHVCEFCFGPLEVAYNWEEIRESVSRDSIEAGPRTMWRYVDLLPIDGEPTVGLYAGYTPLFKAEQLGRILGHSDLWVKNDSVNHPTLSFKDRVVAVALTKAKEFGYDTVACASTGNLANSVAAHAAQAGLRAVIFIPSDLGPSKVLGTLVYGATVVAVDGNYDEVNRLCSEAAGKYRWAFVNINIRPFYGDGSKTYGYEIAEQLGWRAPKHIVVPVGGASLITKIYKGLNELHDLGIIEKPETRMYGAQASGCAPVSTTVKEGHEVIRPVKPDTIDKSIAIGNPADGYYALSTITKSGGWAEDVSDEELVEDGIKLLACAEGVFTETAGGVTVAVTKKLIEQGRIPKDETTVIAVTGQGLKTTEAVAERLPSVLHTKPNLASLNEVLSGLVAGAAV